MIHHYLLIHVLVVLSIQEKRYFESKEKVKEKVKPET
jgi:hypothetical protein